MLPAAMPRLLNPPVTLRAFEASDAGLIVRTKTGRTVSCQLKASPMEDAMNWLNRYERFWSISLDRLAAYAEGKEAEARKNRR